jgi:hypothetical protein
MEIWTKDGFALQEISGSLNIDRRIKTITKEGSYKLAEKDV